MKHFWSLFVRFALMLSLLFPSLQMQAQSNLREGYVITLKGDTLHGDIDYRIAVVNMKQCVFRQNGAAEFKTFLPGEIQGYRFLNNGIYYVSKEVDKEGGKTLVFAEYVLRGNMNLYQVGDDEMVFEDEEGRQASYSMVKAQRATNVKARQKEMRDVLGMLNKSAKATDIIWRKDKSRTHTKEAVMAYVDEVCVDGHCEVFEYPEKVTPREDRIVHPWVKAGFKSTVYKFWNDESITGFAPQISAGIDWHFDRFIKGIMVNTGIAFEMGSASCDADKLFQGEPSSKLNGEKPVCLDFNQLDLMVGLGYQFEKGPVKIRTKAGGIYRLMSTDFDYTKRIFYYRGGQYENITDRDMHFGFNNQYGLFAGAGVEYPLKKCALICDLEYIYDYNEDLWYQEMEDRNGVSEHSIVKQHGFCISLGVKFR